MISGKPWLIRVGAAAARYHTAKSSGGARHAGDRDREPKGAWKSTLATNLAGALARQGHAVMLGDWIASNPPASG